MPKIVHLQLRPDALAGLEFNGNSMVPQLVEIGECGMVSGMTAKVLKDVLERVETWPEEAQAELAEIALEIDAGLAGGVYHATPAELEGIDRGLKAAREGRFATDKDVEAVFAKHRRA